MAIAKSSKATTSKATNKSDSSNTESKARSSKTSSRASASKPISKNPNIGLEKLKTEVASELGVNLNAGYNGNLTAREAGSVGGEMVRRMIKQQKEQL